METGLPLLVAALVVGCAGSADEPYVDHETGEDFDAVEKSTVRGVPGAFDEDYVMDDAFFTGADSVSVAQVQAFLESTPYGRRSFLASERVNGESAASAIVRASRSKGINPIVMLARMQVAKSLVAKSSRPSAHSVDYAFGCGCPDGRACNSAYRGLDKQIECAASTLRRHYDGSVNGTGAWRMGHSRNTLDPMRVTPVNHATASLYAYTPWVLRGRGGNWLVWNITLKYAQAFENQGAVLPEGDAGNGGGAQPAPRPAWIGSACDDDSQCDFGGGAFGSCQRYSGGGICTLSCEGLCPDRAGFATTFCVSARHFGEALDFGVCTAQAVTQNSRCADLPGMVARDVERFVGGSGASRRSATACVPAVAEAPPPAPPAEDPPAEQPPAPANDLRADDPSAGDPCEGLDYLGECRGSTAVWCDNGALLSRECGDAGCGYVDDSIGWYCGG